MMKEPVIDEVVARKFLLGQLSPEEQGQIEELAFEDPDTFTFLESVEEDLVDEFLQEELSPVERQRFNDHFLSLPGRRQDLKISKVLQEHFNLVPAEVSKAEPEEKEVIADDGRKPSFGRFIDSLKAQSFWLGATTATAAVALVIVLVSPPFRDREESQLAGPGTPVNVPSPEPLVSPSLHPTPSPVQTQNKRKSPAPEKQKPEPAPEKGNPVAPYVTLLPSAALRSAGEQPFQLPPGASSVPVGLALVNQTDFKTYDVKLEDEAGREIDRWSNRIAQHLAATQSVQATPGLLIDVRTTLLKPDESYRIVVTGITSKGERSILQGYSFEAKK
jgi:hypothetical protein